MRIEEEIRVRLAVEPLQWEDFIEAKTVLDSADIEEASPKFQQLQFLILDKQTDWLLASIQKESLDSAYIGSCLKVLKVSPDKDPTKMLSDAKLAKQARKKHNNTTPLLTLFCYKARFYYQILLLCATKGIIHFRKEDSETPASAFNKKINITEFLSNSGQILQITSSNTFPLTADLITILPANLLDIEKRFYEILFCYEKPMADILSAIENLLTQTKTESSLLEQQYLVKLTTDFLQLILGKKTIEGVTFKNLDEDQAVGESLLDLLANSPDDISSMTTPADEKKHSKTSSIRSEEDLSSTRSRSLSFSSSAIRSTTPIDDQKREKAKSRTSSLSENSPPLNSRPSFSVSSRTDSFVESETKTSEQIDYSLVIQKLKIIINRSCYIDYFSLVQKDFDNKQSNHIIGWQRFVGFLAQIEHLSQQRKTPPTILKEMIECCNRYLRSTPEYRVYLYGSYSSIICLASDLNLNEPLLRVLRSIYSEETATLEAAMDEVCQFQTRLSKDQKKALDNKFPANISLQRLTEDYQSLQAENSRLITQATPKTDLAELKDLARMESKSESKQEQDLISLAANALLVAEIANLNLQQAKTDAQTQHQKFLLADASCRLQNGSQNREKIREEAKQEKTKYQEIEQKSEEMKETAANAKLKAEQAIQLAKQAALRKILVASKEPARLDSSSSSPEIKLTADVKATESLVLQIARQQAQNTELAIINKKLAIQILQKKQEQLSSQEHEIQVEQKILSNALRLASTQSQPLVDASLAQKLTVTTSQLAEIRNAVSQQRQVIQQNVAQLEDLQRKLSIIQKGLDFLKKNCSQAETNYSQVEWHWWSRHRGQLGDNRAHQFTQQIAQKVDTAISSELPEQAFNQTCDYVLRVLTTRQVPGVDKMGFNFFCWRVGETKSGISANSWIIILAKLIVTNYQQLQQSDPTTAALLFNQGKGKLMICKARSLLQTARVPLPEAKTEVSSSVDLPYPLNLD